MKSETIKYLKTLINDDTPKKTCDIVQFAIRCVKEYKVEQQCRENEQYILELFDKFYNVYCRKGSKEQAKKTWRKKLISLKTKEKILEKARKIALLYSKFAKEYEEKDKQYVPLCSSWLNSNVPDKGE